MKYIAVQHRWWMQHISWEIKELNSNNLMDAEVESGYWNDRNNKQFSHATTLVIEILDNEYIPKQGKKLNIWQRITGRF